MLKAWQKPKVWLLSPEDQSEELGPEVGNQLRGVKQQGKVEQGPELNKDHQEQLQALIEKFSDVFNERPGKARGVRHEINTPRGTIVWERWRPIPHHLQANVHQEMRKILAHPNRSEILAAHSMGLRPAATLTRSGAPSEGEGE